VVQASACIRTHWHSPLPRLKGRGGPILSSVSTAHVATACPGGAVQYPAMKRPPFITIPPLLLTRAQSLWERTHAAQRRLIRILNLLVTGPCMHPAAIAGVAELTPTEQQQLFRRGAKVTRRWPPWLEFTVITFVAFILPVLLVKVGVIRSARLLLLPVFFAGIAVTSSHAHHQRRLQAWLLEQFSGCCPTCGYDLRATPDRCPECGSPRTSPG
jgi:hypothetical protein